MAHQQIKLLIIEVEKLLIMKATLSLYFVIQRCQEHWIFAFYIYNLLQPKKKITIMASRKMFICEISIDIIILLLLLLLLLFWVGPIQQKIKLPPPYAMHIL